MNRPSLFAQLEELGYQVELVERHASISRDGVEIIKLPLDTVDNVLPADILDRD